MTNIDTLGKGDSKAGYNLFLLLVAGLGGLLYGIDVGIIAGALPYLEATFKDNATGQLLTAAQTSFIVAAVLLGSVISTLFAGMASDWLGRKKVMALSGLLFVASIPVISLAHGYDWLLAGRLMQGISAGFIGVVIPLYLAECLSARDRGKGTGIFQWLLTFGLVAAAAIGLYFSAKVDDASRLGDAAKIFAAKDAAWRGIFWVSLPPGVLFVIGSFLVAESPRWLFRKGRIDAARSALLRSRNNAQAEVEMTEMAETVAAEKSASSKNQVKETLLKKKYVMPFLLACVILACTQATGVNSIIGYYTSIVIQAGLGDKAAHTSDFFFTLINFIATIGAVMLVDRMGRKFLLSLGTAGIIASLVGVGILFHQAEAKGTDVKDAIQALATPSQKLSLTFDQKMAATLARGKANGPYTLVIIYSYGDYSSATSPVRSDDLAAKPIEISRDALVKPNKVEAFFDNPFGNLDAARTAPLKIDDAILSPVPSSANGWMTAVALFMFMSFFAIGPGVCVWLALSELMPTRIRSNGMSIALLINQAVSTVIAGAFLPVVGAHGYSTAFFTFAGCTVIYFITAVFFLPETKGKTLEEIEEYFEGDKRLEPAA
jgi:SP family myo-inositol transporter-like MFS transporter 13